VDKVATDTERDKFMTPEEAKAYGLIDVIIDKRRGPEMGSNLPKLPSGEGGDSDSKTD